jgi:hypothetical protein
MSMERPHRRLSLTQPSGLRPHDYSPLDEAVSRVAVLEERSAGLEQEVARLTTLTGELACRVTAPGPEAAGGSEAQVATPLPAPRAVDSGRTLLAWSMAVCAATVALVLLWPAGPQPAPASARAGWRETQTLAAPVTPRGADSRWSEADPESTATPGKALPLPPADPAYDRAAGALLKSTR